MADITNNEALGLGISLQDEASKPIGDVEKAYLGMVKSVESESTNLAKAMKNQSDSMADVANSTEKVTKEGKGASGRLHELKAAATENWHGLDRLGLSWGNLTKLLGAASIGAAIVGVIAFFKKAYSKAMEFRRELALLNETYSMTAKDSAVVSGTILGLAEQFGKSRQEVTSMVKRMLDIGLVPDKMVKLGITFKGLSKDILEFSAATGTSVEGAVDFADQLIRINRIPANRIRNISSAIKAVADNSKMTTDELISFNKSLEPLFAALPDQSKKMNEKLTVNMLGLAGALSDLNIDSSKSVSQFADMLDSTSESGQEALIKLSQFTNLPAQSLQNLIKTNPAKIFDSLAKSAASMPVDQLHIMAKELQPLGLDFVDLSKLRNVGKETGKAAKSFEARAKASLKASEQDKAAAAAAQKRQIALDRMLKPFKQLWENTLIKIGSILSSKVITPLFKKLVPYLRKFSSWLGKQDWAAVFDKVGNAISVLFRISMALSKPYRVLSALFSKVFGPPIIALLRLIADGLDIVSEYIDKAADSLNKLIDEFSADKSIQEYINTAKKMFSDLADTVSNAFSSAFDSVSKFISDSLDTVSTALSSAFDFVSNWISNSLDAETKLFSDTFDSAADIFNSFNEKLTEVEDSIFASMKDGFNSAVSYVGDLFTSLGDVISGVFKSTLAVIGSLWDKLKDSISFVWDKLKKVASVAVGFFSATGKTEAAATINKSIETKAPEVKKVNEVVKASEVVAAKAAVKGSGETSVVVAPNTDSLLSKIATLQEFNVKLLREYLRKSSSSRSPRTNYALANSGNNG